MKLTNYSIIIIIITFYFQRVTNFYRSQYPNRWLKDHQQNVRIQIVVWYYYQIHSLKGLIT